MGPNLEIRRRQGKLPPGCKRYKANGVWRIYYRHTRPQTPLPGVCERTGWPIDWSVFLAAYETAKACAGRDRPGMIGAAATIAGSLDAALARYFRHDAFTSLPTEVRGQDKGYLEKWRGGEGRGKLPLKRLEHKHLQNYINSLDGGYAQRNALRAIRKFTKFCLKELLINNDPAASVVKDKIIKTGGFRIWTETEVDKYVARWPLGTTPYLALQIMLCTALRKSDAIQVGPRHVRGGVLENYAPQKTRRTGGKLITVPLHRDLVAAIEATAKAQQRIGDTYLVTEYGKPFSPRGFANRMREWCNAAGLEPLFEEATGKKKNVASHGLRKLCLTRLAEIEGITAQDIAAVSGHKNLAEVQTYIDNYNRKKAAASAIRRLEAAQNTKTRCLHAQDA